MLEGASERLTAFMKNRHSEDKGDPEEEEKKESSLISPLMNPFLN